MLFWAAFVGVAGLSVELKSSRNMRVMVHVSKGVGVAVVPLSYSGMRKKRACVELQYVRKFSRRTA